MVITGIGVVSACGLSPAALWDALNSGRSGLARIAAFDPSGFPCQLGGEVRAAPGGSPRDFSARDYVPKSYRKSIKVMARDIELAVAAAKLAVDDARLTTRGTLPEGQGAPDYPGPRMGCHIGAGLIAAETDELTGALATSTVDGRFSLTTWGSGDGGGGGMENLQPLWMLKYLPNMLACHVTIIHGTEGPSNTLLNAEASGLLSIGESMRVIQRDAADVGFAGSAESKVSLMGLLRMDLAGRLAHTGAEPDPFEVVRPFVPDSKGGVLGEAGGILVLEEAQTAATRGATVYARAAGFGAAHGTPAIPPLQGKCVSPDGLELAIRAALKDAGAAPEEIDAIVPQGAGTPRLDQAEASSIRTVFGSGADHVPLVLLAPFVGDCAAGAGGLQAGVGAMCVKRQELPAGATRRLDGSPLPGGPCRMRRILVCSTGMGGQSAALVLEAV